MSTTEPATLSLQQQKDISNDNPPDPPQDLPLDSTSPDLSNLSLSVTANEHHFASPNELLPAVKSTDANGLNLTSSPTYPIEDKNTESKSESYNSSQCADASCLKKEEEDTDTGVFLESGSSASTDIRDTVSNALLETESSGCISRDSVSPDKNNDSHEKDIPGNNTKDSSDSDAREPAIGNRRQTTEESSTSGCGEEDTSFDSSPEPLGSSYGGIYPADGMHCSLQALIHF